MKSRVHFHQLLGKKRRKGRGEEGRKGRAKGLGSENNGHGPAAKAKS